MSEELDVVYTWVDGAWPGYAEILGQYAGTGHDRNPNRYRDNLDLLKYSVRSLHRHLPWVRNVYFVTTQPQVPEWLDTGNERVRLLHHDAIFDAGDLPTFNSFAIVSNLYRIPGVSRRFIYMEDDRLFGRPVSRADFFDERGRPRIYVKREGTQHGREYEDPGASPWEGSLAWSNKLLDDRYGRRKRGMIKHAPVLVDVEAFSEFASTWKEELEATTGSRFRGHRNIVPEHMFPWYLIHEGRAEPAGLLRAYRTCSYMGLDNFAVFQRAGLARLRAHRPKFYCLNDNYGEDPDPRCVGLVRAYLESLFPEPSPFERGA